MTEQELKALKISESVRTESGEKYTRTIGGWIYSNFAGNLLFIPDVAGFEDSVVKKDVSDVRKSRTTK